MLLVLLPSSKYPTWHEIKQVPDESPVERQILWFDRIVGIFFKPACDSGWLLRWERGYNDTHPSTSAASHSPSPSIHEEGHQETEKVN